jgi:dTDP-4-dehydrorhamnose reductase
MKVLVYGGQGWIGSMVIARLQEEKHTVVQTATRLHQWQQVEHDLDVHQPTHVFVSVGRTHGGGCHTIDYLEHHMDENLQDNLEAHLMVTLSCAQRSIHVTMIGTGCIYESEYDETQTVPLTAFDETDLPNFQGSSYSLVCGLRDRLLRHPALRSHVLWLRIRMPLAHSHPRNFIDKIVSYEHIHSCANSMSVLPTLIPYIPRLMGMKHTGPLNFTNPGVITHAEILQLYQTYVDPHHTWTCVPKLGSLVKAARSNTMLDTTALEQLFPEVPTIRSAVTDLLQHWCKLAADTLSSLVDEVSAKAESH